MQYNDIIDELSQNFIEYSVAVNTDRAIPDSTSGLKPVARRILWSAYDSGYVSSKPPVKSARVVGDVMGRLHPHGDASIYGALVRLSQDWIMRYPLINIHGNNGNIAGDGPASMRYTEARLSKLAEDGMMNGIKKKNVDFMPNYDETEEEPITLPSIFPNLLCNPNNGIGVSISCNWAPHNLGEVAQAIYDYMDGGEPMLPGPDFPTGGVVINKNDIPQIMRTGHGTVKIRGQYKIEQQNIIFYEIPYGVSIETILTEIGDVCDKKEIEGIIEIRDESNKNGLRIVIECEKNASINKIVQQLFVKTSLQSSFSYNQIGLVNKTPTELNLKDCIRIYVNHGLECIVREAQFDLNKAKERQHIVEGLLKALEDIDNIVALIKNSKSSADARDNLMRVYHFSEPQAKAIVDMKLGRLAGLEKIQLEEENAQLLSSIDKLNTLIASEDAQKQELRDRLQVLVDKYGDPRRTMLTQLADAETKEKEVVIAEEVVVTISQNGVIKRVPKASFKIQRRGTKGAKTKSEPTLEPISTNTVDTLMLFTQDGMMYKLAVNDIPDGTDAYLNTLIKFKSESPIIAATSLYKNSPADYVIFIMKQGLIKKSLLSEYQQVKRGSGIIAVKIKDGDSIANVVFMNEEDLVLVTKKGMIIRFQTTDIAPIGRNTSGVKGIKLSDDDEVLIGLPVHKEDDMLVMIEESGIGKKCKLADFPCQGRYGKGLSAYKGDLIGAAMVDDNDTLLLWGNNVSMGVAVAEIPLQSRMASGCSIIKGTAKFIAKM